MQNTDAGPLQVAVMPASEATYGSEIAILTYALRLKSRAGARVGMDAKVWRDVDVVRLYEAARLNKLALVIDGPVLDGLPERERVALHEMVERYRARTVAMNARIISHTLTVSAALAKERIAFAVMKGVSQQKLLYGDYFAKPVGDVDILVNSRDYRRARLALEMRGFAVAEGCRSLWWRYFLGEQHMMMAGTPPVIIDLHYRLQQPGSPSPRNPDAFVDQRDMIELAGTVVPVISRIHRPILSAISIAKALFNREASGGYALDFYADVRAMTCEERRKLVELAEGQGLGNTVLLGFRLASLLFGERFPDVDAAKPKVLQRSSDGDLVAMVLAPWDGAIRWPLRRDVLRDLCGPDVMRYAGEAAWAATADLCRRWFEPDVPPNKHLLATRQAHGGARA